ncbi:hypothetical protein [Streptosporangium sp. CA-115845]|uniref:hypothetical protein n=1 Tax=Streptosporangium sp. CA-115845 TaxID=3240071 RepID=UPI003D8DF649
METRNGEHTRYFRSQGGSIGEINESQPGAGGLPEGAVEITEKEFQEAYAGWQTGVAEHVAGLEEAEAERAEEDYEALRAAGIPQATAQRLSGYDAERRNR